jgi:hypothetical protein
MARWLRFLTAGGAIDGRRVVTEATLREVTRPHVAINDAWSYGLGWAIYRWNGHTVVEHNGGSQGISALMSFIPERRVGFAFLANTSPNFMTRIGNAGALLWPVLLDEIPAPEVSPSPSPAPSASAAPPGGGRALPSVDELVERMVKAHGGERNLRRHRSMEMRAGKTYENQGVEADLFVVAEAPDRRSEEETWTAAGTSIGRVRVFFDGTRGGQETTFGQDSTYGEEEIRRERRRGVLHPMLDPRARYREVRVDRRGLVGGEESYVLALTPASGGTSAWHVSARTGRLLQREEDGETTTFDDYRDVDGEWVPFRTTTQEALGEVVVVVKQVRFNVPLPPDAFGPRRPAAPP